ncbi:hypothetical protein DVH24_034071 [Malus domestica]|uniref:BRWD/PHIP ancillary-like domain-containing protein n=1 Tax=Malus domestica TaxID=3750 RepID=A0A498KSM9_MALDO|nr:hypothetical protein DVH24_034071 [Malus domestica]
MEWRPSSMKFSVGVDINTGQEYMVPPLPDLERMIEPLPYFIDAIEDTDSVYNVTDENSSEEEKGNISTSSSNDPNCSEEDSEARRSHKDGLHRSRRKRPRVESSERCVKKKRVGEHDRVLFGIKRTKNSKGGQKRVAAHNAQTVFSQNPETSTEGEEDDWEDDSSNSESLQKEIHTQNDDGDFQIMQQNHTKEEPSRHEFGNIVKPRVVCSSQSNVRSMPKLVFKLKKQEAPKDVKLKDNNQADLVSPSSRYQDDSRVRLEAATGSLASCNVHIEEMNNVHQYVNPENNCEQFCNHLKIKGTENYEGVLRCRDGEHTGTRAFEDLDGRELCHTDEALVSSSFDYSTLGEHKQKGIEGSPEIEKFARRKHSGDYASLKFPAQNSTSSRDLNPNDSSSMDPNSNFGVRKMGGGAGRSTSLKFVYKRRTNSEGSGGNVEEYATNINDHHDSGMDLPAAATNAISRTRTFKIKATSRKVDSVSCSPKLRWGHQTLGTSRDAEDSSAKLCDEVVYLRQGHQEYLKLVKNLDEGPWGPWESIKENIKVAEICKVESLDYASLPGSRESCCKIKLRFVDHSSAILGKALKLTLPEIDFND